MRRLDADTIKRLESMLVDVGAIHYTTEGLDRGLPSCIYIRLKILIESSSGSRNERMKHERLKSSK